MATMAEASAELPLGWLGARRGARGSDSEAQEAMAQQANHAHPHTRKEALPMSVFDHHARCREGQPKLGFRDGVDVFLRLAGVFRVVLQHRHR